MNPSLKIGALRQVEAGALVNDGKCAVNNGQYFHAADICNRGFTNSLKWVSQISLSER